MGYILCMYFVLRVCNRIHDEPIGISKTSLGIFWEEGLFYKRQIKKGSGLRELTFGQKRVGHLI